MAIAIQEKSVGKLPSSAILFLKMAHKEFFSENELAALARRYRKEAGKTRAQAAREMEVAQTSIFQAEEIPEQALTKLRIRMIESYSRFNIEGPIFRLRKR